MNSEAGKTKQATKGKPNRLVDETSPYLLQHAHNPVDWYAWGAEALERAKNEDKPIFLSIGYAACHWCHVMEHESFENQETADLMNRLFVCIKVDREERPDLDDIYMKSVQMMTGHGGWPMSVFLTPELKPFFGGTYFPPIERHGMPSFRRVLEGVAKSWQEQRENIENSSEELSNYLKLLDSVAKPDEELDISAHMSARKMVPVCDRILRVFDQRWGGFGGAPKFPQTYTLSLLLRQAAPWSTLSAAKRTECLAVIETTLNKMAYGGMHDQIGGGFARYSVDRQWLVPHFEKMLYDNALLAKLYLDGFKLTGRQYWQSVAIDCLDFVLRELTAEVGGFYSSLDADSEGEEGKFYAWKPEEIVAALGEDDGAWVNQVYGVTAAGNFEHATTVLYLSAAPEEIAQRFDMTVEAFWQRLNPLRQRLLEKRAARVRPGRDEKILTSWNGLMISALVSGYAVLQDQRYLEAAKKAANFILANLSNDGRLLRTWGQGKAKLNGYLDDYAFFVQALIDLASVDFDPAWMGHALKINEATLAHFWDSEAGAFFYTSDDHEALLTRPKNFNDGPTPSGTAIAVHNLLRLAQIMGKSEWQDKAISVLKNYVVQFEKAPDQFATLISALDVSLSKPTEIVLVADSKHDGWHEMLHQIHAQFLPNAVIVLKDAGAISKEELAGWLNSSPLTKERNMIEGKPTAYVCHDYSCQSPVTEASRLLQNLA